jgi:protein required for attachment to host cells
MLRWLKTVVVSDVEKAHEMRQVGIGKTVRSPLSAVTLFLQVEGLSVT